MEGFMLGSSDGIDDGRLDKLGIELGLVEGIDDGRPDTLGCSV